jgi:hypothetical protein
LTLARNHATACRTLEFDLLSPWSMHP